MSWMRKYLPSIGALLIFSIYLFFQDAIIQRQNTNSLNVENLYNAIFDWAAIQTGFLFGIYTYILAKTDGIVGKIKQTKSFLEFINYIKSVLYLAFSITIVSLPFLVLLPKPQAAWGVETIIIGVWLSYAVFVFLRFFKVIRVLTKLDATS